MLSKKNQNVFQGFLLAFVVMLLSGCATYYQKNLKFQEAFSSGDLEGANKLLDKNEKAAEGRNRLLFFLKKGVVLQMMGRYEESNKYFEQAYIYVEDYRKNYGMEALTLISNPTVKEYPAEDHEKVLIHYYKALNFLKMNRPQEALVEARRLNNKLNALNDRYENRPNSYADDAFAHVLMGIAYEMDNDVNNAFIAYRNAYNTYKSSYTENFALNAPEQLKQDLMRTAYLNGFIEELQQYESEFGVDYQYQKRDGGELIFFWHNGLGPVKAEWSINFTIVKGDGGVVTLVNEELDLFFTFPIPENGQGGNGFGDLKLIRVAFPKYESRIPVFNQGELVLNGSNTYDLETAEDIDAIARSILQDRMLREIGAAALRLATKQAAEYAARQENQDLGAAISLLNALTEKADTRNWQTLPYSISYSRIPLNVGENKVTLKTKDGKGNQNSKDFIFSADKGETVFHIYHSLESFKLY
ncbi:COG3014 family protein [Owenweeksia hongkongensis]|uniref:COG3014 family protein n=1 Tax=Owenweeksia hongkongensis TaxID=253245 RepID=UPI003A8FF13C